MARAPKPRRVPADAPALCSVEQWLLQQIAPGSPASVRQRQDLHLLRAQCHDVARRWRGSVLDDTASPGAIRNHQRVRLEIQYHHQTIRIFALVLSDHPVLAFASASAADTGRMDYDFLDLPELAQAFGESYLALTPSVLDRPFSPTERLLREHVRISDLEDLDYWRPSKVHQVLFNFWD